MRWHCAHSLTGFDPEQAGAESRWVSVADHRSRFDPFAGFQSHAGGPVFRHGDFGDAGIIVKARAIFSGDGFQCMGEGGHPAPDIPYALRLDMRNQHQRGRCLKGGGAAIGRVATEQLLQARIVKMLTEHLPETFIGADRDQVANPPQADPPHQWQGPADLGIAQHRPIENFINAFGFFRKAAIASGCFGTGKLTDGIRAFFGIGKQIERFVAAPGMAGERVGAFQFEMIVAAAAGRFEYIIDNIAHRENRGASIDCRAFHIELPDLAAGGFFLFQNGHRDPARREQGGAYETANAGADNDGLVLLHLRSGSFA